MNLLSLSEKTKWPPLIILVPLKIKNLQVNEGHKIPGVRGFRKARYFPLVSEDLKRFDIRSIQAIIGQIPMCAGYRFFKGGGWIIPAN
jgi:hypothetical protein